jgi:hypothetical protein
MSAVSGDKKMPPAPLVCTEAIISHIEIHRHRREFHTRCLIVALYRQGQGALFSPRTPATAIPPLLRGISLPPNTLLLHNKNL